MSKGWFISQHQNHDKHLLNKNVAMIMPRLYFIGQQEKHLRKYILYCIFWPVKQYRRQVDYCIIFFFFFTVHLVRKPRTESRETGQGVCFRTVFQSIEIFYLVKNSNNTSMATFTYSSLARLFSWFSWHVASIVRDWEFLFLWIILRGHWLFHACPFTHHEKYYLAC